MPGCIWMNRNYKIFDFKKKANMYRHCHLSKTQFFNPWKETCSCSNKAQLITVKSFSLALFISCEQKDSIEQTSKEVSQFGKWNKSSVWILIIKTKTIFDFPRNWMPIISTRFIAIHIKINVLFNEQVSLLRQHWHRSAAEILIHFGKMDNVLCSNWIYLECKTALTFFNVENVRNILYCSFFSRLLRSALYKTRLKEIYLRFVVEGAKLYIVYQHVAVATEMNSFVSQVTHLITKPSFVNKHFFLFIRELRRQKKA